MRIGLYKSCFLCTLYTYSFLQFLDITHFFFNFIFFEKILINIYDKSLYAKQVEYNFQNFKKENLNLKKGSNFSSETKVKNILKNIQNFDKLEMKLRFSSKFETFLKFYDIDGRIIYLKYKEDKYDDKNEKKVLYLQEGQTYEIKAKLLAVNYYNKYIPKEDKNFKILLNQTSEHKNIILIYQLINFENNFINRLTI